MNCLMLNITFLKIAFIVVQWGNENSASVVKEKKAVGAVELKEGTVKFPHNPILHYAFSSWIEKIMTKTIDCHWGCAEILPHKLSKS